MGFDRNKVIKIAEAEVGYLEKSASAYKKNPAVLDEKTAGAGHDNYTKYGRDMHKIYPSVMDFPAAWCDCFVDWCFYKAYGISTAKSLLGGNFDDYTVASAQLYQKKGALDTTPEVGSQIFFTKNGKASGAYHTGLVIAVSGKLVTTIEGNTTASGKGIVANGGCVAKRTRTVTKYTLFGHPAYNDKAKTAAVKIAGETDKPATTAHRFDKSLAGKYVVTASSLNLRAGSDTDQSVRIIVPHGKTVQNYGYYNLTNGERWLYVTYQGHVGFVSDEWLTKR